MYSKSHILASGLIGLKSMPKWFNADGNYYGPISLKYHIRFWVYGKSSSWDSRHTFWDHIRVIGGRVTLAKGFRLSNVEFVWGKSGFQLSPYFMPANLKRRLNPQIQQAYSFLLKCVCLLTVWSWRLECEEFSQGPNYCHQDWQQSWEKC